jgi:multiple sugar transport system permease protein
MTNPYKQAARRRSVLLYVIAAAILSIWAFPILWAVVVSLKSETEVLAYPPRVIFAPTLDNYRDALFGGFSILPSFFTSFVISAATTVLTIVLAVPAAYAFARLRLRGNRIIGFYTLVTQMIPPVGLVIPYFLILNKVGWLDT